MTLNLLGPIRAYRCRQCERHHRAKISAFAATRGREARVGGNKADSRTTRDDAGSPASGGHGCLQDLETDGLINRERGIITISDRAGLQLMARALSSGNSRTSAGIQKKKAAG